MPLVDTAVQPRNPPDESRVPRVEPFRDTARVAGPDPLRPEPSSPQAEDSGIVDCDVCGWEVKVERKRDWQYVQSYLLITQLTRVAGSTSLRICDLMSV